MLKRLPGFVKNFYFLTALFFFVWMLFFDSNDLIAQYKLTRKLRNLENEKIYYQKKIEEVKADRKGLMSNADLLEKFARERYLMKKKNEDIYVIEEK